LLLTPAGSFAFADKDQPVDVLVVKGPIFSSTAEYIKRGIKQAEQDGAICVIQMDTPGGLVKSMREIVQDISAARVPVVIFVYPQGGMATSAGAYIAYAAHVTVMAPGTHIGSAHPVAMGSQNRRWKFNPNNPLEQEPAAPAGDEKEGEGKDKAKEAREPKKDKERKQEGGEVDVEMEKATHALVALMRSLAEKNGRNADWGEKAVRESVSATVTEAVKLNVADFSAENMEDLLKKLDGRTVTLEGKEKITLHPSLTRIKYIEMTGIEKFLLTINDPQIAMLLMFLGMLGLYYELAHPGLAIPGIVGGISIILGLYTLGSLPINYAALALIILSAILFLAELFTQSFGAFTVGAVISFVLGAVFLIPAGIPYLSISRGLITSMALFMGIFSFLIITFVLKSLRAKPVMGMSSLPGKKALVRVELSPTGMVLFEGELWKAKSTGGNVPAGGTVVVQGAEGLTLLVKEGDSE
jgi:membrane-bound serine protease (ClpP class)